MDEPAYEPVTAPVTIKDYDGAPGYPHTCHNATGGSRCDICFGPMPSPKPPLTSPASALTNIEAPTNWSLSAVAAFVRDIAMDLYDEDKILAKHKLSRKDYDRLKTNEYFKNAVAEAVKEWHKPASTAHRLAMQAAIAVEDGLPTVAARLSNKNEPLGDIVGLLKVLADIAGVIGGKAAAAQTSTGEKFKITINLGADVIMKDATPVVVVEPKEIADGRTE